MASTIPHTQPSDPAIDGGTSNCRICRDEATDTELLLSPCCCRGSMKFVHNQCLLDFLSLSRVESCGICGVTFRLTKLYAPDMPQSLPAHILLAHMIKNVFHEVLEFLSAVFKASKWICWYPLAVRLIWTLTFWIGDEGLAALLLFSRDGNASRVVTLCGQFLGQCCTKPLAEAASSVLARALTRMKHSTGGFADVFIFIAKSTEYTAYVVTDTGSSRSHTDRGDTIQVPHGTDPSAASLLCAPFRIVTQRQTMSRAVKYIIEGQIIIFVIIAYDFVLELLIKFVYATLKLTDFATPRTLEMEWPVPSADQESSSQTAVLGENTEEAVTENEVDNPSQDGGTRHRQALNASGLVAEQQFPAVNPNPDSEMRQNDLEAGSEVSVQLLQTESGTVRQGVDPAQNTGRTGWLGGVANFIWGDLDRYVEERLQAEEEQMQAAEAQELRGWRDWYIFNYYLLLKQVFVIIFSRIFVPYKMGSVIAWLVANPVRFTCSIVKISRFIQNLLILIFAALRVYSTGLAEMATVALPSSTVNQVTSLQEACYNLTTSVRACIYDYVSTNQPIFVSDIRRFSAASHAALLSIESLASCWRQATQRLGWAVYSHNIAVPSIRTLQFLNTRAKAAVSPSAWSVALCGFKAGEVTAPELAGWFSVDRFWAILFGYAALVTVAFLHLQHSNSFSSDHFTMVFAAKIMDAFHLATGRLRAILIVGLERIVLLVYCGILVDLALLPLFDNTTILSRLLFTRNYPVKSLLVYWFVGAGYTSHVGSFQSMCRKVMRPGIFYFLKIELHDSATSDVCDIVEKGALRRFRLFLRSIFFYSVVAVCLGSALRALSCILQKVLPIHYPCNGPVLELPVDLLLLYNLSMPLAFMVLQSEGGHAMYNWWFRRCARSLRLTSFLFGDRKADEEGRLQPFKTGPAGILQSFLLAVDESGNIAVKSWKDGMMGDAVFEMRNVELDALQTLKSHLVQSGQLLADGSFVRAPASDSVAPSKHCPVFVAVHEDGKQQDGNKYDDVYFSDKYCTVYLPPGFRSRMLLFVIVSSFFVVVTSLGAAIVPLVTGRAIFRVSGTNHVRLNDIHAFSIGIYTIGADGYLPLSGRGALRGWMAYVNQETTNSWSMGRAASICLRVFQLIYTYVFLVIMLPLLTALLVELYVLEPLHMYIYFLLAPTGEADGLGQLQMSGRSAQKLWTHGLLYTKLAQRLVTSLFPTSRAASAVRLMLRLDWQRADVHVLTWAIAVPGMAVFLTAIFVPPFVAKYLAQCQGFTYVLSTGDPLERTAKLAVFFCSSYPCAAVLLFMMMKATVFASVLKERVTEWTSGLRDELYLLGHQLHNFEAAVGAADREGEVGGKT
ncbi:RING finger membrane protein [Akanthomyces lecanii RCEF 1005]|uniref:RING-type E3 ubiquitin transferase n=1 Tax=Akanthomyces lecanii RCEF 1005 TaxID=1081108 RepID=A0A167W1Z0_CORDF|nr:RING finger membrane protein [Akanthomyces lecanii RCEF 1005]